MSFKAIKPDGFPEPDRRFVEAELDRLGRQVSAQTKQYPPWRPWKNPPKTGRRAGGKRTGDLGKSWGYKVTPRGAGIELVVESDTSQLERPYNKFVQGKKQTKVMRGRGWKTVGENFDRYYPEAQKRLAAWAQLKER